ncbi:MAG: response regulator [Oscillospiraceae bacterium]|jgi:signal transduction histidine kinase/DNA-binding NarL/FixJ family response regulator/HPt (histidine-containing phosphotransfer) domain-containing protein|nr:response regulator [Oscillospiraceae bacterium]
MKNMSIRYRLVIPLLVILILGVIAQTVIMSSTSTDATGDLSLRLASEVTRRHANELEGIGLAAYDLAVTIEAAAERFSGTENGREKVVAVMAQALGASYNVRGIWTCWEPDAFDGSDADHINKTPYDNAEGRFAPYVYRDAATGEVEYTSLSGYDDPVKGAFYQTPKKAAKPISVSEPETFQLDGEMVRAIAISAPVFRNGEVVGIVGIDIALDFLAEKVNSDLTFETGQFFAISPDGMFIVYPSEEYLMTPYTDTWISEFKPSIDTISEDNGISFIQTWGSNRDSNEEVQFTGIRFNFANSDEVWVVGSFVTEEEVAAPSVRITTMITITSLALVLISTVTVLLITTHSLRELPMITSVAQLLAVGDIDITIGELPDPSTRNEIDKIKLAADALVRSMQKQVDEVRLIGSGEYDFEIVPASDRDLLNIELQKMAYSLKEMFNHLNEARQDAVNASETKSNFLANMSHEMRTPLNAVIGLSELALGNNDLDEDTRSSIEKISTSGMTLLGIVNDILDLSKIEAGKLELINSEYDVPSLINDTIMLNIMRIGSKPIDFRLHISPQLPSSLCGDELRIKQVLNNFLSNAFKYTMEGTVDWYVSSRRDGDSVWLTFRVSDTGIGIKPEGVQMLFSKYGQVDTKSNRKIEGTGLGLSIAKGMVEMMDGEVSVESEYGVGSTFTAVIRQGFVSDVIIGEQVSKNIMDFNYADSKRKRNTSLVRIKLPYARVLVVDDVQTNLDVAKGILKPYEMQIDYVTSGRRAVELIRAGEPRYNAIFMDHMMPEMDGIEATRIIREEIGTEYAKTVPILALTANAISGNDKMFLEHGFQAFLSKPIDILAMDNAIRQWVRDKSQERSAETAEPSAQPAEERQPSPVFDRVIDGLDLAHGLQRFGGDEDSYIDVLRSFVKNTPGLLVTLADVTEATLADYTIIVHGIKSGSRSIGAADLGDFAEKLEFAGKRGDAPFVLKENRQFLAQAETLLSALATFLAEVADANPKPRAASPNPATLRELAEACLSFDIDGADAAVAKLDKFDYDDGAELIEWIHEQLTSLAFRQIAERLSDV